MKNSKKTKKTATTTIPEGAILLNGKMYIPKNGLTCLFDAGQGDGIYVRIEDTANGYVVQDPFVVSKNGSNVMAGLRCTKQFATKFRGIWQGCPVDLIFAKKELNGKSFDVVKVKKADKVAFAAWLLERFGNLDGWKFNGFHSCWVDKSAQTCA
jgi:hypothetical protein